MPANNKEYDKAYREKNKEREKQRKLEWRNKNKEREIEYFKKYRDDHKKYFKKYRDDHATKKVVREKVVREKVVREKVNRKEYHKEYFKKRFNSDISFRITNNLRSRLRMAVTKKAGRTIELIGCSISDLIKYLENKFQEGMSWENYGRNGWHIDHIRPCASFNLLNEEEQKECFHYTNLQPLWAIDNFRKSDNW